MSTSGKLIALAIVWTVLAVAGAVVYKYLVAGPRAQQAAMATAQQEYDELRQQAIDRGLTPEPEPLPPNFEIADAQARIDTLKRRLTGSGPSGGPDVKHQVRLALDSFSGYSLLRSEQFSSDLRSAGIGLELVDDQADYQRRLESLERGDVQMAVFTIDALIKAIGDAGKDPATIVLVLDETIGADAMVAYQTALADLDALNQEDAKIVLTRDSPSETLARVVLANFNVPRLGADPWISAQGAADVYQQFKAAQPTEPKAFVLWEPYVSKALELKGAQRLIDSSRFTGFIVDVLVAERDYLLHHEAEVRQVIEAYLRVSYETRRTSALQKLVTADAKQQGEPLTTAQAQSLVEGIWWKNTQENYAHFGVLGNPSKGLQPLDTMIRSITDVLVKTGALPQDPLNADSRSLYFPGILKAMHAEHFHPSLIPGRDDEQVRTQQSLAPLSEQQWAELEKVGTLPVERIVFAPGTSTLRPHSKFALARLVDVLDQFPQYYLSVRGSARRDGDAEANMRLAKARAQAASQYIVDQGIASQRVHAEAAPLTDDSQQTVTFVLGQIPY